jgi:Glycosyltransferases involved in cell wall biogenesis
METYLPECLDSVLGQSLSEIEVVCVDDGSTDGGPGVLRKYADKDSRVRIIRQNNQGAGPAQNAGLRAAVGEFICFLGADDYYHDARALEDLYQAAKQNGALVCGGGALALRDGQLEELNKHRDKNIFPQEGFISFADFLYVWIYTRYIFQRKLICENSIFFPDYRRGQDPVWCAQALDAAGRFYALPRIVYVYRLGYREINWTPRLKTDTLQYNLDLMRFAVDKNYPALFSFMEDELYYMAGRFKREKMPQGSKEYWRQLIRHRLYQFLAVISWGSSSQKYKRKSEEAGLVLSRAKSKTV